MVKAIQEVTKTNKLIPQTVSNWINGKESPALKNELFAKMNPANGLELCQAARSRKDDVNKAVKAAKDAQINWSSKTPVERGEALYNIANKMQEHREEIAQIIAIETGKSFKDALGETDGAIALGIFFAGEGRRLYSKTLTSGVANKYSFTVRQPLGVAALVIAANTPIANAAWKAFPALICGNTLVMKAPEDTPATTWFFAKTAHEAGLPPGVFNVIQGYGEEAGAPLVEHPDINIISFTGSTKVGRIIAERAGKSLKRISLELGGKNPLVVCDDADLDNAVKWSVLSAFSNAGQRCAAASRIIIFDAVYDKFKNMFLEKTRQLKVGSSDSDDFGPVVNATQLENMLNTIKNAEKEGAVILTGGSKLTDPAYGKGYYISPAILENISPKAEISTKELFGPIVCLYRVKNFNEAINLAGQTPYGLTAAIHTKNINRAIEFCQKVQAGVTIVNAGTYGSEPHMPFGGFKDSGNGTREPGVEALDVYSELKNICIVTNPDAV